MTNEELLQQAKDQVAKKYKNNFGQYCSDWNEFWCVCVRDETNGIIEKVLQDASLLAIQSAREEGASDAIVKAIETYKRNM